MKPIYFLTILLLALSVSACKRKYKYYEIVQKENLLGVLELKESDPKVILANSDTEAYLDAFENFCISKKVSLDMKEPYKTYISIPLSFRLINKNGDDISKTIHFPEKEAKEKEIESRIYALPGVYDAVDQPTNKQLNKKLQITDSAAVKQLIKYFTVKKDEFSNSNEVWYQPKSSPRYTNANGLFCYFQTVDGVPSYLRFRMQYYADDWLFINQVQFSIDGIAFDFFPSDMETDSGYGGYIWEWFDEASTGSTKKIIDALCAAKSAKMKLIGRQYYKIKSITPDQILNIKRSLDLFKAMGGEW